MAGTKRQRAEERRRQAQRKRLKTRLMFGGFLVAVVVGLVVVWPSSPPAVGTTDTESWDLPALEGDARVALDDFAGRPTVAAFFASWCEICHRELPGFAALSLRLGDQVNFVGINTMNNGSGLPFARQAGIDHWPLARDIGQHDGRQLATNFGARGSPTTVIYDAAGEVVDVTLGGMSAEQLALKLSQIFGVG